MEPLFLGLRHVALNVRDVQKSIEFYSKVLGMKLEWMPDEDNAYLTSGQDNLAPISFHQEQNRARSKGFIISGSLSGVLKMSIAGPNKSGDMASASPRNPRRTGTAQDPFIFMTQTDS